MNKELKIYKAGKGSFGLAYSEDIDSQSRLLVFRGLEEVLHPDDLLWSEEDKIRHKIDNFVVVTEKSSINDDKSVNVYVSLPDGSDISKLRKFENNERFTIMGTFREIEEENT